MTDLDEQLDTVEGSIISTKCINGHKFKVPKEKIQTSSSGKSFVTLCPKCNKVARLRKEDVFAAFGVNPRDHVAVGNLFATLSGQSSQLPTTGDTLQDVASQRNNVTTSNVENDVEDDDENDDDEIEIDDIEDDDESDDKEYTAQVETADDVTGRTKKVRRFRVVSDESENEENEEDEEDDDYERTPVKTSKQVKKSPKKGRERVRRVIEDDEDDEDEEDDDYEDVRTRGSSRKPRRGSMIEDLAEPADPNDILKEIIEESGMDERDVDRVFDYIDMQPDGWQPSAIKGVLEMFITPTAANRISQKYQGALYIEQKKREREQQLMQIIGTPQGNIRLSGVNSNTPPFNNPVTRGLPNSGSLFTVPGYGQSDPRGTYPQGQDSQYPPYEGRQSQPPYGRRSPSTYEIKQMISDELESRFEKLQNAITQTKREDALQNEISQMRNLIFDILKQKSTDSSVGTHTQADPLLQSLLANQSELNKTLLTHTIAKTDKEDPMQKVLLQELMELKKSKSATPSLNHTTEELTQRIQLQKLANELELAQAEFRDKSESRAFTRDLAGQALTKIGESFATAYLESQRMAAMQSQIPSPSQTLQQIEPMASPAPKDLNSEQKLSIGTENDAQPRAEPDDKSDSQRFLVRGTTRGDGTLEIPCPTCSSPITARIGDTQVKCGICGSTFNASNTKTTHTYAESEPADNEITQQQELESETTSNEKTEIKESGDRVEEPKRAPQVLL